MAAIFCLLQAGYLLTNFQHNLRAIEVYQVSSHSPEVTQAFSTVDLGATPRNRGDLYCEEDYPASGSQAHLRMRAWHRYLCGDVEGAIALLAEAAAGQTNLPASEHAHLLWNHLGPEVASRSPGSSDLAYSLVAKGSEYVQSNDEEEAWRLFQQAVHFNQRVPYAHYGLGSILARRKADSEKSIVYLRREIELNPGFPYSYTRLAEVLLALGRLEEAEEVCLQAISQDKGFPVYQTLLRIYLRRDDCGGALRVAGALIQREEGDPIQIIRLLIRCGESQRALRELQRLLEDQPEHTAARELLAEVLSATETPNPP